MKRLYEILFHSIRGRIIAGVILLHAVMMGLVVLDMLSRQQHFMEAQISGEGLSQAKTLAANAPSWLISRDVNGLGELVDSLKVVKHLRLALILDREGKILATSDPSLFGLVLNDPSSERLMAALKEDAASASRSSQLWHDGMIDSLAEVVVGGGQRIGYARIILDAAPVQAELDAVTHKGVAYALAAIALGGLISWLLVRTMTYRLQQLSRAADSIASGHLRVDLPDHSGRDEVSRLTRDFALMADALDKDISERIRLEGNLHKINQTLEQRVREETARNMEQERLLIQQSRLAAMGEMICNIAHHWRQPISALNLLLANIEDAYRYKELDDAYIEQAAATGNRLIQQLSATIDNFRDYFQPDREKSCFSLADAVNASLNILDASLKDSRIEVIFVPGATLEVRGYLNEFSQVILNVVNNAKSAILENPAAPGKIIITTGRDDAAAWLKIADNGGGIPAEALPKIFDPYFTTRAQGVGLGLYMSKMLMKHMDGDIAANNEDGGAVFTLRLPLGAAVS